MSKSIDWSKTYVPKVGNIKAGANTSNKFGSMRESFAKSHEDMKAHEKAQETLKKAYPVMKSILLQRMVGKHPIKITRAMPYTTEVLGGNDEEDGFYNNVVKGQNARFQSVTKSIPAGTELTFINLEKSMNQLWFKSQDGKEYGIYLEEQDRILMYSDIADLVAENYIE